MKNYYRKYAFLTLAIASLMGCDQSNNNSEAIAQNSLPLIINTVSSMEPVFGTQKNSNVMVQVCKLANGEIDNNQLKSFFYTQQIDIDTLAKKDKGFGLVASGDKSQLIIACAAYLASSGKQIPDVGNFVKPTGDAKAQGQIINQDLLKRMMPATMAIQRANADYYALIAKKLASKKEASLAEYSQDVKEEFSKLAPDYLNTVKKYIVESSADKFELQLLQKGQFVFSEQNGFVFNVDYSGPSLYFHGVPWLAQGKLLGNDYSIRPKM